MHKESIGSVASPRLELHRIFDQQAQKRTRERLSKGKLMNGVFMCCPLELTEPKNDPCTIVRVLVEQPTNR
jgi:hypothetical protein